MTRLKQGYVQIYTGNGKGKSTAAFGLALRAAGAGLKVFIGQFAKGSDTGELKSLKKLGKAVVVHQFGTRAFIKGTPTKTDCARAVKGLAIVAKALQSGAYGIVILDEACGACANGLLPTRELVNLIKGKKTPVEVVLTGRNAPLELVTIADLVTEMKEIKHYFNHGVKARKGIEF